MLNNSNISVQIKYLNEKGKVMSRFQRLVSAELERYKNRLAICKKQYKKAPEGTLKIRKLKNDYGISVVYNIDNKVIEKRITKNGDKVFQYIRKEILRREIVALENNIKNMEKLLNKVVDSDVHSIWMNIPEKFHIANRIISDAKKETKRRTSCINIDKCLRDKDHIHKSKSGAWVRSKNELYIFELFESYNIPFEYEPEMIINGKVYRPDFVIHLGDGSLIIWEHFGLLDKADYCERNSIKIHDMFMDGYVLWDNFIATTNNRDGGLDSMMIDEIMRNLVLPKISS